MEHNPFMNICPTTIISTKLNTSLVCLLRWGWCGNMKRPHDGGVVHITDSTTEVGVGEAYSLQFWTFLPVHISNQSDCTEISIKALVPCKNPPDSKFGPGQRIILYLQTSLSLPHYNIIDSVIHSIYKQCFFSNLFTQLWWSTDYYHQ